MRTGGVVLRVELLGQPRAWLDGTEFPLGPARQTAVFAILAARRGHIVTVAELLEGVWGGSAPASAKGSLHTYVSGLRRALRATGTPAAPTALLSSTATGYRLALDPAQLDSARFEHDVARAEKLAVEQAGDALAVVDEALARWSGEAYLGVPGPFAERERERLAELRLGTLELRASLVLRLGGHQELIPELSELTERHPLRESLYELLMRSLHRSGRTSEALETYFTAQRVLRAELGVEPRASLQALHQEILTGSGDEVPAEPERLSVVPPSVRKAIEQGTQLRGRAQEVTRFGGLVADVLAGRGGTLLVEGEPGIGKSELLAAGLSAVERRGCQLAWAVADELHQRFPLHVITECLGAPAAAREPRRAILAADSILAASDPFQAAADRLLAFVDEVCTRGPLVMVLDDLHWADEASVLVWQRLAAATRQLPLLLVAAGRPGHGRPDLAKLKQSMKARGGEILPLKRLSERDTSAVIADVLRADVGDAVRPVLRQVAGNPLYAKEMAKDLLRRGALRVVDGAVEVDSDLAEDAPRTLLAAVDRTLIFVSPETLRMMCTAALLGQEFAVSHLVALTDRSPLAVARQLEEAADAGIVVAAGDNLSFHHPLQREALYRRTPQAARPAAHRRVAEALAAAGGPVELVARQLAAVPMEPDAWVVGWLTEHHGELSNRAPRIAAELLQRALDGAAATDDQRAVLIAELVRVLFRLEENPIALTAQAITMVTDPIDLAEMRQLRAALKHRHGDTATALAILEVALNEPATPELWITRHRTLLANIRRGDLTDLDRAQRTARRLHAEAVANGERYAAAHALQTQWLVHSIRREHDQALDAVESALAAVADDRGLATMRIDLLDNELFTLQNLDRLDEAENALHTSYDVALQHGLPTGLQVSAAVHYYWLGRWDEALAELDSVTEDGPAITFYGTREVGAAELLLHGVAALIAVRRDERALAAEHLGAVESHSPNNSAERENCDFYLAAAALAAEQRSDYTGALRHFGPVLRRDFAPMMLRHQWLPDVVRIALAAEDTATAREAAALCAEEAAAESVPGRAAAAAQRCQALLDADPEGALAAADHYRAVHRPIELADALQEAAEQLAKAGHVERATAAVTEATGNLLAVSALWNIRRGQARLRRYGISAASVAVHRENSTLSPLELRVARMVAANMSNPKMAATLHVPRRTVQAYVARVMAKLHADSRADLEQQLIGRIS